MTDATCSVQPLADLDEKPYEGIYKDWTLGLDYLGLKGGVLIGQYDGRPTHSTCDFGDLMDLCASVLIKGWRPLRGHELRFLRSLLDLSQTDVAIAIGTTRATIARWEANWTHLPEEGKEGEALPVDENLPAWGDRSLRLYAGAVLGLSGLPGLLAAKEFGCRLDGERSITAQHDGQGWTLEESTFGPVAGVSLPDPRAGRRLVCRLMTGRPFGDEEEKHEVGRLEGGSAEEIAAAGVRMAAAKGLNRWHAVNYQGYIVAHRDPDVTFMRAAA